MRNKTLLLIPFLVLLIGCHSRPRTNQTNAVTVENDTCLNVMNSDLAQLGLSKGVHFIRFKTQADNRLWSNEYEFDSSGMLQSFHSFVDNEPLYDWYRGQDDLSIEDILEAIQIDEPNMEIEYWEPPR